jgi:uncharacterized protein YbjT (DUF2867 family)
MTILVTGATGNVGAQVVRDLDERGEKVRALVRDPAAARRRLGAGVELAQGDLGDPASVRRALEGVELVFLSSGDGPAKVAHETAVIDAAATAGVRRIAKISTVGAEAGSPLPGFDWNGRIEDHLHASGVPAVVLRAGFFMTNLLAAAEPVRATGTLPAPAGGGRIAMTDPRDAGAVGAVVLTADGHDGRTYELTGPEALSYGDVAAALSAATGRRVTFVDVPEEAARQGLVQAGLPDWLFAQLVGVFGRIRAGDLSRTTDTVRALTGRAPRTFAQFAREHARLFGAGASTGVAAPAGPAT